MEKKMADENSLSQILKVKFGTGPSEPTVSQLKQICSAILKIHNSGKKVTEKDWSDAVYYYCPSAGKYKYAGIDNSDLNTLLALAIQAANK